MFPKEILPKEILSAISDFLDIKEACKFAYTCKHLYANMLIDFGENIKEKYMCIYCTNISRQAILGQCKYCSDYCDLCGRYSPSKLKITLQLISHSLESKNEVINKNICRFGCRFLCYKCGSVNNYNCMRNKKNKLICSTCFSGKEHKYNRICYVNYEDKYCDFFEGNRKPTQFILYDLLYSDTTYIDHYDPWRKNYYAKEIKN